MCYPASSVISQDSSASSSLCVANARGGREAVNKQKKTQECAHHEKDEDAELQSCKSLKKNHIDTSDARSTNLKQNIQLTQNVETHDKHKKLLRDKSDDDKSERDQKQRGKYSTKKNTGLPESEENICALKRSGNENVPQKGQIHKQHDSGSIAPGLIYQNLSPMTPGGDGFSFAKPEYSKRQKSSFPSSQTSKMCISEDKERGKGTSTDDRKFQVHVTDDKVKAQDEKDIPLKLSGCHRQRHSKLPQLAGKYGGFHFHCSYHLYIGVIHRTHSS